MRGSLPLPLGLVEARPPRTPCPRGHVDRYHNDAEQDHPIQNRAQENIPETIANGQNGIEKISRNSGPRFGTSSQLRTWICTPIPKYATMRIVTIQHLEPLRPLIEDARQRNSEFNLRDTLWFLAIPRGHARRTRNQLLSDLKKPVAPGLVWGLEEATNNPEATGSRRTGTRSLR